jgi:hypothetical protein
MEFRRTATTSPLGGGETIVPSISRNKELSGALATAMTIRRKGNSTNKKIIAFSLVKFFMIPPLRLKTAFMSLHLR